MEILAIVAAALFAAGIFLYNRLIRSRNRVDTAWSDIDVQLQRRHDLVPQLVAAVRQYAAWERSTLEAVSRLRAQAMQAADVDARSAVEEGLGGGLHRLVALAENYPDLKADRNFLSLQQQLVETENYLQFARRYYNGSVRDYNTRVETIPANIIAAMFRFRVRPYFQKAADDVANVPLVELGTVE